MRIACRLLLGSFWYSSLESPSLISILCEVATVAPFFGHHQARIHRATPVGVSTLQPKQHYWYLLRYTPYVTASAITASPRCLSHSGEVKSQSSRRLMACSMAATDYRGLGNVARNPFRMQPQPASFGCRSHGHPTSELLTISSVVSLLAALLGFRLHGARLDQVRPCRGRLSR